MTRKSICRGKLRSLSTRPKLRPAGLIDKTRLHWQVVEMVPRFAKAAMRRLLERQGFWLSSREVLPLGIDYLWDVARLSKKNRAPIAVALDIGAHEGETAVEMLAALPGAQIHSFEPHPAAFARLAALRSTRLHSHNLAVSDHDGSAALCEYETPPGAASSLANSLVPASQFIVRGKAKPANHIAVRTTTVDQFCHEQNIGLIDLLKIDTEGHEASVLAGASGMIETRAIRFIFVEFNTLLPKPPAIGGSLIPLAEKLEPHGYRLVATYPVLLLDDPLFVTLNALFALG